jgi:N-acetylglucosaminyldiphosphoundecaprenol N-acetyl-beta-D-mannosaminyltransferase
MRGVPRVLETNYFAGTIDEAASAIVERALCGEGGHVSLLNVHVLMAAQRDLRLAAALGSAWRVFPDGAPVAWLQRRRGATRAERVAGPDLMLEVLRRDREARLRHFLFGSTPDVVRLLTQRLRAGFPDCNIVGTLAPLPGAERDLAVLEQIRATEPHLIWAAFGAPKQELWAHEHARALAPALVVGVGAAFDFNAGAKQRAPRWMQDAGLEWLHRLASEPRRLGWRYLSTNSRFVVQVLREIAR